VFAAAYEPEPGHAEPTRSEIKQREREEQERAEVDRILEKISTSGMESLTRKERKALERASAKGKR
jgi:hypothetical protein